MNFLIPSNTTSKISVFIIWLFHLCGMVGISYGNKEFFLAFTPKIGRASCRERV